MGTFASAVVLVCLAMQPAEGDSVRQLTELQQQLARAWVAGDRAAIERIIAPEWTVTGPDGGISTRADVLRDVFETRTHRIRSLTVDDVRVRVFGDAAVVTGRTRGRGESGSTPYDVEIRFTDTFVRREGQWQAVASHASMVMGR
jgi:ketosteroid isomerase-like protein